MLVLQGNAATKLRCGGKYYSYLLHKWFLITMQKKLLKSANIWQSYSENKSGPVFFWLTVYLNIKINHVSECVYKLSYPANCTRLKISFLICLTEHLVFKSKYIFAIHYSLNISSFKQFHKKNQFITKSNYRITEALTGQASRPYNKIDALLLRTSCNVTCSDAVLPNSSKIALAAR